jgi:hypothetical protein
MKGLPLYWLGLLGVGTGCGGLKLEGSLTSLMELDYQRAELALLPDQLTVDFLQDRGGGEAGADIVFQVTAKLENLQLQAGAAVNLAEALGPETQRGVLSRNVLDDPRQSFPALQRGSLRLDALPESGQQISGSLSATFVQCIEAACGRTVFGDFEALVR